MKNLKIIGIFILLFVIQVGYIFAGNSVNILLNGQAVLFNENSGFPYTNEDSRTMVPLRITMESAGFQVAYNSDKQAAIVSSGDTTVEIPIGKKYIISNGQIIQNDTKAVVINGRTYLPIRAVLEAFGAEVGWDSTTKSVVVTIPENYKVITIDGGDTSGQRQPNVKVNVGFGNREYWAYTNAYGQLIKVTAKEIRNQDEKNEPVNSKGRYYSRLAQVPGVESADLDCGHVIADSLGGVSNAYNITPQDSKINQNDQEHMESKIRKALEAGGSCKNFVAIITYPNTTTQIPKAYDFSYELNGVKEVHHFENSKGKSNHNSSSKNISNESPVVNHSDEIVSGKSEVVITKLDKRAEYVEIKNISSSQIDISGWTMVSEKGNQSFKFPIGTLINPNQTLRLTSGDLKGTGDFTMSEGTIWNNSKLDPALLYDAKGNLVSELKK